MATERIEFGRVLEKDAGEKKLWLLILLPLIAIAALVIWAMQQGARTSDLEQQAAAAKAQAEEFQKSLDERDKLLAAARAEEGLMRSPGQALGIFYAADPRAQESGVVFAHPDQKAVRVYLYGLGQPPDGQEYAVAARTADGGGKRLGNVLADDRGSGFLLAKDVPDGTVAIEVVHAPTGQEGLEGATPRISARYPGEGDRGILAEPPRQARRGRSQQ
jgi:hypothetical protein